jgi:chromate transporter
MKIRLIDLFLIFLRIGGFTFGGGYAMLPLIEKELVEERKLLTDQEFLDIIAVIQGIPGIIAFNSSLFIGYRLRGIIGALTAATGISLPSIVIISLIAKTLLTIQNNPQVISVFTGIRACVVVLIFWAGLRMGKKAIDNSFSLLYTLGMIIGMLFFNIHPIFLIIMAGLIGILIHGKEMRLKDNATN